MSGRPCLLSAAYLPPIEWFARLVEGGAVIEVCDHYVKQTYRNRCHIATPQGTQPLVIPVSQTDGREALISEQAHWRHTHWQALVSAYRMSPFFEFYADDLQAFYATPRAETLYDYDLALVRALCRLMHVSPEIRLSTSYMTCEECERLGVSDLRDTIHPKRPPTPNRRYYQVFADTTGFQPNLSIADLLFNLGPETAIYLHDYNNFR